MRDWMRQRTFHNTTAKKQQKESSSATATLRHPKLVASSHTPRRHGFYAIILKYENKVQRTSIQASSIKHSSIQAASIQAASIEYQASPASSLCYPQCLPERPSLPTSRRAALAESTCFAGDQILMVKSAEQVARMGSCAHANKCTV